MTTMSLAEVSTVEVIEPGGRTRFGNLVRRLHVQACDTLEPVLGKRGSHMNFPRYTAATSNGRSVQAGGDLGAFGRIWGI